MRSLIVALLAAYSFTAELEAAIVTTVEFNGPDYLIATGIHGLEVNGAFYDVDFTRNHECFDAIFGTGHAPPTVPVFYFDLASATAAIDAISATLNAMPNIYRVGRLGRDTVDIHIPTQSPDSPTHFYLGAWGRTSSNWPYYGSWSSVDAYPTYRPHGLPGIAILTFSETGPVPEPASLTLWSLGALICATGVYRRRRRLIISPFRS